MTISKKLYTGFSAALFISLVIGLFSMHNLSTLGEMTTTLATTKARNLYLAGDINNLTSDILGSCLGMNLRAHMNDPSEIDRLHEVATTELARLNKDSEELQRMTATRTSARRYSRTSWKSYPPWPKESPKTTLCSSRAISPRPMLFSRIRSRRWRDR